MVISLCQRKGGVGKTTSVVYLSQVLHQTGHEVIALDLDEDNSLVQWSQLVNLEYPVKRLVLKDLGRVLEQHQNKHIIIDTPPNSPHYPRSGSESFGYCHRASPTYRC